MRESEKPSKRAPRPGRQNCYIEITPSRHEAIARYLTEHPGITKRHFAETGIDLFAQLPEGAQALIIGLPPQHPLREGIIHLFAQSVEQILSPLQTMPSAKRRRT